MRTGTSRASTWRCPGTRRSATSTTPPTTSRRSRAPAASLAPGGLLLLETQHRDKVAALHAEVSPQRLYEERPDGIVLRELWFDPIRGRAGEHVRQLRADGTAEDRAFSLRVYSATELVALCAAAGLTLEAVYGGPGSDAVLRLDAPARGREAHRVILAPLLSIPSPSDPLIVRDRDLQAALVRHADRDRHPARRLARPARARPARLSAGPCVHHRHLVHPGAA